MAGGARWRARTARFARVLWTDLTPWSGPPAPRLPWLVWTVVVVLALIMVVATNGQLQDGRPSMALPLSLIVGAAQGCSLLLALHRPMAGVWVSLLAGAVVSELVRGDAAGPVWAASSMLAHLCVLAIAGSRSRPRVLLEMWLLTVLAWAVVAQRTPPGYDDQQLFELTMLSAIVLIVAGAVHEMRRARRRLAEQREIATEERDRRAVLEERSRIARELHDVLAHHMSVIAIQAEAAPHRVPDPPEPLARSFTAIHTHAQHALTELRRVLGVLRAEGTMADAVPHAPQPTLERMPELVTIAREAGLRVSARTNGAVVPLPPGVDVSAYRIVQEALNNAMRHAPGSQVRIEVDYGAAALRLRVANGPPSGRPAGPGSGHGVLGMRERAGMLEGELVAEATAEGGFVVEAMLPVAGEDGR